MAQAWHDGIVCPLGSVPHYLVSCLLYSILSIVSFSYKTVFWGCSIACCGTDLFVSGRLFVDAKGLTCILLAFTFLLDKQFLRHSWLSVSNLSEMFFTSVLQVFISSAALMTVWIGLFCLNYFVSYSDSIFKLSSSAVMSFCCIQSEILLQYHVPWVCCRQNSK